MKEYDVEDSILPLQPSLDYTAPELVRSKTSGASSASDIFSFACLAYHLVARKPLLECHSNVKMVTYISCTFIFLFPHFILLALCNCVTWERRNID